MNTNHDNLKRVTIGQPQSAKDGITIVDYDPNWPIVFEQLKQAMDGVLKIPHRIEHCGSTSVPGLCAKPIIDILLLVEKPQDEMDYVRSLEKLGYKLRIREPQWYDHRMLKKEDPQVNLHVFAMDCPEARRMLLFRDWLRCHDDDMELYGSTKKELAKQDFEYVQDYADAKTNVVNTIFDHIFKDRYHDTIDPNQSQQQLIDSVMKYMYPDDLDDQWDELYDAFVYTVLDYNGLINDDLPFGDLRKDYRAIRSWVEKVNAWDHAELNIEKRYAIKEYQLMGKIMALVFDIVSDKRALAKLSDILLELNALEGDLICELDHLKKWRDILMGENQADN